MKLAVVVTVILALVPATANAVTPDQVMQRSLVAARSYWGRAPDGCPNGPTVVPMPDGLDTEPGGALAAADTPGCTIYVQQVSWQFSAAVEPVLYCSVIVHEWGHNLGFGHSLDPTSVMYGMIGNGQWRPNVAQCAAAFPPDHRVTVHRRHRGHHHRTKRRST